MPDLETMRHKLPLLAVAQAQKEITHNEALVRIDALLHPVVQAEFPVPPTLTDTDIGKCWIVAASSIGEWATKTGQIAIWIGGGWRFCIPVEGMQVRLQSRGNDRIWSNGVWIAPPTISNPAAGSVIDIEARAALIALLAHLRATGHITS